MKKIPLPSQVSKIYEAVCGLQDEYPDRKFTPDGHLVGSIGEVIAAQAFNLELLPMSYQGHDAKDASGRLVQIKLTGGKRISMYDRSDRLIVMRIVNPQYAELVYDGSGDLAWNSAGKMQKNGQRSISLSKLIQL